MRHRTPRQTWSDGTDGRVRVLLECEHDSSSSILASTIERHGYEVRTCEGPDEHGCDLLVNGVCALVDGADVVVNMLRTPVVGAEILDGVAAVRRPPVVVAPGRTLPIDTPVTGRVLVAAITQAIQQRNRPVPVWGDGFC